MAPPEDHDAFGAGGAPGVARGADQVQQFVGEVVAILIGGDEAGEAIVMQQGLHPRALGGEFAPMPLGDDRLRAEFRRKVAHDLRRESGSVGGQAERLRPLNLSQEGARRGLQHAAALLRRCVLWDEGGDDDAGAFAQLGERLRIRFPVMVRHGFLPVCRLRVE